MIAANNSNNDKDESMRFASVGSGVYVIDILSRANYAIAPDLRQLVERLSQEEIEKGEKYAFIFNMEKVDTMDSTFMGALAGIALRQRKDCASKIVLCNLNEHCQQLLTTLGVSHFVELRSAKDATVAQSEWQTVDKATLSKVEMTTMMLESHLTLSNLDSNNEVQFAGVIDFLKKSLDNQTSKN